jgi:hypothetical protein
MLVVNKDSLADARRALRAVGFRRLQTITWTSGPAIGGDPSQFRRGRALLGTRRDYIVVGTLPGARLTAQRLIQAMPVSPATKGRYPTEKPEYLGEALARIARVRRGDLVVDPYCGSGALLVGARRRGAVVVGIDRSPTAVKVARRRLGLRGSAIVRRAVKPGRDKPAGRGT